MKTTIIVVSTLALASLAMVSMASAGEPATSPHTNAYAVESPPAVPDTPAAVESIIYAREFTLENGYPFTWSKESPVVTSGYLLVLKVDPDLVFPRQVAEPVLYVGAQTAQRVNHGFPSGHVIAIVPGDVDLTKALIWFGTPELPERVDTNVANAELNLAEAAGIKPFAAAEVNAARAQAGEELKGATVVDVLRVAADLIRQYAPEEKHIAETCVPADETVSEAKPE
jgi:hypothetical protein